MLFPKIPKLLYSNIILDLIIGSFFVYYLKIDGNQSTFLRTVIIAFAAYDFTDLIFSAKTLIDIKREKK
ncbi:hypothetical protein LSA03_17520 [Pediococcus argentinicus]|nr:hypothetical protein LSA03_17520 [Pediococcus argentinicus]